MYSSLSHSTAIPPISGETSAGLFGTISMLNFKAWPHEGMSGDPGSYRGLRFPLTASGSLIP